jgi:histidyl-tRNA synthetase
VAREFQTVSKLFNFKMMEPAPIEHLSTLRVKSGSDVDKEIYSFKDKGGRDIGLRFDLTVGMTRYVCSHRGLKPPVKLAALAGAWRYDEPQHARYRWFRQWDLEIFGPPSTQADAEVIESTFRLFEHLGVRFTLEVGDRGAVQQFINKALGVADGQRAVELMRALDKAQKRTLPELKSEYEAKGFDRSTVQSLFDFGRLAGKPDHVLSKLGEMKVDTSSLGALRDALDQRGLDAVRYNMGVVRGIDYYTGVVFEVNDDEHPDLGSLAGGGRYDLLPRAFGRPDLSATGAAGGIERISLALSGASSESDLLVYVASAGEGARSAAMKALSALRASGVPSEAAFLPRSLSRQLEEASGAGARWAVIVGDKEVAAGGVTLRDLQTRNEELLPLTEAIGRVKKGTKMDNL